MVFRRSGLIKPATTTQPQVVLHSGPIPPATTTQPTERARSLTTQPETTTRRTGEARSVTTQLAVRIQPPVLMCSLVTPSVTTIPVAGSTPSFTIRSVALTRPMVLMRLGITEVEAEILRLVTKLVSTSPLATITFISVMLATRRKTARFGSGKVAKSTHSSAASTAKRLQMVFPYL